MALIVTVCIVIITVYTVIGFKNIKAIREDIKTIRDDVKRIYRKQEWHCKTKYVINKEEVEDYEETESEN